MTGWVLVCNGYDPAHEGVRESLCTPGNGYVATRGAAEEATADGVHYPGTYFAGCYDRLPTEIDGRVLEHEDPVNAPNWLPLIFRPAGGAWLSLDAVEVLGYRQALDLRQDLLVRDVHVRDGQGRRMRVTSRRLVHMATPHLAALETTITAENWAGPIEVRSALDGRVANRGVERYRHLSSRHRAPLETRALGDGTIVLRVRTVQSEIRIAQAARTRVVETSWLDWSRLDAHRDVFRFARLMVAFRKAHPSLGRSRFWRGDVRWYGVGAEPDLSPESRSLVVCLRGGSQGDDDLYVMINGYWEALDVTVQDGAPGEWRRVVVTGRDSPDDIREPGDEVPLTAARYRATPRSVVVLTRPRRS